MTSSRTLTRNFFVLMTWVAVLGSLMGSYPRCQAFPLATAAATPSGSDGAVATCTTSGGAVANHSASGGGFANCYAYATGSSQPPDATGSSRPPALPSGVLNPLASFVSTLVLIPIWVLVYAVITI